MGSDCKTVVTFRPAGPLAYDLQGTEYPEWMFPTLLRVNSHFCMLTLRRKRRQIQHLAEQVVASAGAVEWVYGICQYPGYSFSAQTRTLVIASITPTVVDAFVSLNWVFDAPWRGWEDWAIFTGDELAGYACSHEGFGTLYGDRELFTRMRLQPIRGCTPMDYQHTISALREDESAESVAWPIT